MLNKAFKMNNKSIKLSNYMTLKIFQKFMNNKYWIFKNYIKMIQNYYKIWINKHLNNIKMQIIFMIFYNY